MSRLPIIVLVVGPLGGFGCGGEPHAASTAPIPQTVPSDQIAAERDVVLESCEMHGDVQDADGRRPVRPTKNVHVRAVFRVEDQTAAERLLPVVYFVKYSEKHHTDVIQNSAGMEKTINGGKLVVEADLHAPRKPGEFRVEIFDGGRPGPRYIFGKATLTVEDELK